jgi:hypothetical protein
VPTSIRLVDPIASITVVGNGGSLPAIPADILEAQTRLARPENRRLLRWDSIEISGAMTAA